MLHRRTLAFLSERHAQSLHRWRPRTMEPQVTSSRRDHLDWLAHRLGSECNWHSVIAAKSTAKPASKEITAHDNLVLAAAKRLCQPGQHQCRPLTASVHLKHAIFLEREAVDWLKRKMHHGSGRVVLLQVLFRRCDRGIHAWIVDDKRTAVFVSD